MMQFKIFIVCAFSFYSTYDFAFAQNAGNSYMTFDQFFQNYTMINPASNDSTGKFIVKVGDNTLYGLFDGVNRFYFDADYRPGRNTRNSYSRFGALVQRINRGSFIHTTK